MANLRNLFLLGRVTPYAQESGRKKVCVMAVILIVEDDVFIRATAEMMIQDSGHDTLSAGNVEEALSLLRSPQHIDALFTDIYLKKLARQAVLLRPNLRILYTTGNYITDKMKALFVEGTLFLTKPYSPSQLQDSVKSLLVA